MKYSAKQIPLTFTSRDFDLCSTISTFFFAQGKKSWAPPNALKCRSFGYQRFFFKATIYLPIFFHGCGAASGLDKKLPGDWPETLMAFFQNKICLRHAPLRQAGFPRPPDESPDLKVKSFQDLLDFFLQEKGGFDSCILGKTQQLGTFCWNFLVSLYALIGALQNHIHIQFMKILLSRSHMWLWLWCDLLGGMLESWNGLIDVEV